MKLIHAIVGSASAMLASSAGCHEPRPAVNQPVDPPDWRATFPVDKNKLVAEGASRYFSLQPGTTHVYRGGDTTLTITVLTDTMVVDGVTTRVVEEREEEGGALKEVSRNYFALDPATGDVYYFGEDVDVYKNGGVSSHPGAWRSGLRGAKFGLMMPGTARAGDRFYQEVAPEVAMDRVEIVSIDERVATPAGVFDHCVELAETTPLERGAGHKWYAPGVGLIKDGDAVLASHIRPQQ